MVRIIARMPRSGVRILRNAETQRGPQPRSPAGVERSTTVRKPTPDQLKRLPLVAIVGRPNVGKSTLFNRLIGQRRAIVGDEPGITRDRIYGESDWNGLRFALVDTGGIVPDDDAVIPANILKQAAVAIGEASALIWVVDVRKGLTPLDEELAQRLRQTGKRVLVAANKTDAAALESDRADFYRFGFEEVFAISAEQGNGIGELLDELVKGLTEIGEGGKGKGQRA